MWLGLALLDFSNDLNTPSLTFIEASCTYKYNRLKIVGQGHK